MALAKGLDTQFFQILRLKLQKDGARDVVDIECFHDAIVEAIALQPSNHISWRPVPRVNFI
jgi:hypothetical protein